MYTGPSSREDSVSSRTLTTMKTVCLLLVSALLLLSGVSAQLRPTYLGSRPYAYPGVNPKFEPSTEAAAGGGLDQRFGQAETTTLSADEEYRRRVASWPREKQPFWYVNSIYIKNHTGNTQPSAN